MQLINAAPLVEARNLSRQFTVRRAFGSAHQTVKAVDDVTLRIGHGEIFGLVGESGCGKSTIGRLLLRLLEPTAGQLLFDGVDITHARGSALATLRRQMQIVFQDPFSSLNPSFDIRAILWEGLRRVPGMDRTRGERRIVELLETVGLRPEYARARPHELSGGQRQRVGIARALTVNPRFLVLDEPTSALDVSIQSQMLNLFVDLQQTMRLTLLFISHDLDVIRYLCDQIAVMYLGRIVEQGPAARVLDQPQHPYTAALLASRPVPHRDERPERRILPGELPSPLALPTGCRFHPRCPHAQNRCQVEVPRLEAHREGAAVACFYPLRQALPAQSSEEGITNA